LLSLAKATTKETAKKVDAGRHLKLLKLAKASTLALHVK